MRQLRVLIEQLPPGGAYYRAMQGPWSDTEHLLAIVGDRIAENTYALARIHGAKTRRPKPLPRPGAREPDRMGDRAGADPLTVKRYLDQFIAGSSTTPIPAKAGAPPAPDPAGDLAAAVERHGQLTEDNLHALRSVRDAL